MYTAGKRYTAGLVEHHTNNESWQVLPTTGDCFGGYRYSLGKMYLRVTHVEPYGLYLPPCPDSLENCLELESINKDTKIVHSNLTHLLSYQRKNVEMNLMSIPSQMASVTD